MNLTIQQSPNFKKIQLSEKEAKSAAISLNRLLDLNIKPIEAMAVKNKLFNIFNPYLIREAKQKTRQANIYKDVLAEIYLNFSELLNDITHNSTVEVMIDKLSKFWPSVDTKKSEYIHQSLDTNIYWDNDMRKTIDIITEKNLPTPQSSEYLEEIKSRIQKALKQENISPAIKERILARMNGMKYGEIAQKENVNKDSIRRTVQKGVMRIQFTNGALSEKYNDKILQLSDTLGLTKEVVTKLLLKNIHLLYIKPETLLKNIKKSSKVLNCTEQDFIRLALKQTSLFMAKSESLSQIIKDGALALGCSREEFINAGFKQGHLFVLKTDTIRKNIEDTSKKLNCSEKEFIKAGLKHPDVFCLKPETIVNNVKNATELLECTEKEFIKAALALPPLFYTKPETLVNNIKKSAQNFDCSIKELTKLALKRPNIFCQKPETLIKNLEENSRNFNCTTKEFIKAAFRQPQLFIQKPETLLMNVLGTVKILGCPFDVYIKAALEQPPLFYMKGETIMQNVKKSAKICNCSEQEFIRLALTKPTLFYIKPETIEKNVKLMNYHNKIQNKKTPTKLRIRSEKVWYNRILGSIIKNSEINNEPNPLVNIEDFNMEEFMKTNVNKVIHLIIPKDEAAEDLIKFVEKTSTDTIGKNIFEFEITESKAA